MSEQDAIEADAIPERLSFTSPPALMTAVVASIVLLAFAMYGWWALGREIRQQITWPQATTLLVVIFAMIAIMLAVGYSRLWANEKGVIVRNGLFLRRYSLDEIAGVRLRPGDAWSTLLIKKDGELVRKPVLAIQFIEGESGQRKVVSLRRWLVANGASSEGIGG